MARTQDGEADPVFARLLGRPPDASSDSFDLSSDAEAGSKGGSGGKGSGEEARLGRRASHSSHGSRGSRDRAQGAGAGVGHDGEEALLSARGEGGASRPATAASAAGALGALWGKGGLPTAFSNQPSPERKHGVAKVRGREFCLGVRGHGRLMRTSRAPPSPAYTYLCTHCEGGPNPNLPRARRRFKTRVPSLACLPHAPTAGDFEPHLVDAHLLPISPSPSLPRTGPLTY